MPITQYGSGSSVRPLAESALLAAITVLLMFLGTFLPVAGFVIALLWPIPVMVVILRHGVRYGTMTVLVTVALAAMFLGVLQALFAGVVVVGMIGVVFGVGLRLRWRAFALMGAATGVIAVSFFLTLMVFGPLIGIDLMDQMQTLMAQSMDTVVTMYTAAGIDPEVLSETQMQLGRTVELMQVVFPAVLMISAAFYALWTYGVTRLTLPRLGYHVPALPPFANWRAPYWVAILFLGAYFSLAMLGMEAQTYLSLLAENILFLTNAAYMIFGAALLYFLLRRVIASRWFAGILCALLAVNPLGVIVLPLAAILDSGLNFRQYFRTEGANDQ